MPAAVSLRRFNNIPATDVTAIFRTLGQSRKRKHNGLQLSTSDNRSHTTMERHIPKERKEMALHIPSLLNVKDRTIRHYIGISERPMRYIRKTFRAKS